MDEPEQSWPELMEILSHIVTVAKELGPETQRASDLIRQLTTALGPVEQKRLMEAITLIPELGMLCLRLRNELPKVMLRPPNQISAVVAA